MSNDPIELLREIYPKLDNGYKSRVEQAVNSFKEMQARLADLESTLQRQPLPEALASINVRVVDPSSQMEYQVTIREARAGIALIGRIPDISAALMELGLVAMDTYIDSRQAERESHAPSAGAVLPTTLGSTQGGTNGPPLCPDGHGAMKQSTKAAGEWYCSYSVGVHPQTQKKLYCMHKAKA